ncbi:hypothetical protein UFOVP112_421 [uncultured Caudovirales phage]|uniref:Cupin domain-containing protein n=1 Tax=uncultured Caudovirales phage TaxID=2100421 RepID=A0A6J5L7K7_9CAUD|nr:hypothetical protein UFOVP112_421 [uncultured Caudovirales phage]
MKKYKLSESGDRGWFIGAFDRAVWKTDQFEVAYMFNPKGDISPKHLHKVAKELSLIVSGHVIANGEHFTAGEIFEVMPGEELYCEYLEDTVTVCVKTPSILNDKYYI